MSVLSRLLVWATSPLRFIDRRVPWIEEVLELRLIPEDIEHIRSLKPRVRLGAYYHWYLQKLIVARQLRHIERERALALIQAIDRTNYGPIEQLLDTDQGILVSIPHHGHYVLGIIALAARLRTRRRVNVFYEKPEINRGNAIFDHVWRLLFGDESSNVAVLHNNRRGLSEAMKALRNKEIVVIMPDAAQSAEACMLFNFYGRVINGMLGTASLSRTTHSVVLPAVACAHPSRLSFKTWFGTPLKSVLGGEAKPNQEASKLSDYALMSDLFGQLEQAMAPQIYMWQHIRHHQAQGIHGALLDKTMLDKAVTYLDEHPIFKPPVSTLDLRTNPAADTP